MRLTDEKESFTGLCQVKLLLDDHHRKIFEITTAVVFVFGGVGIHVMEIFSPSIY